MKKQFEGGIVRHNYETNPIEFGPFLDVETNRVNTTHVKDVLFHVGGCIVFETVCLVSWFRTIPHKLRKFVKMD